MMKTITPKDMLRVEQQFLARSGMPSLLLMERAALALLPVLGQAKRVLFICGAGNNGGDGLATARLFSAEGGLAEVWLTVEPKDLPEEARANAQFLSSLGIAPRILKAAPSPEDPAFREADWIVDALFGTGLSRPLTGLYADLVAGINASGKPVLAVDIPSGVDGITGQALGCAVRATRTVTFHRAKPGHYIYPGRSLTGELTVAPLGIAPELDDAPGLMLWTDAEAEAALPMRMPESHKGDFGHVLCVAGSRGMAGAAALCANAALSAGAGLVTIACPGGILDTLQQLVPCAMALEVEEPTALEAALVGKRCVAVGPGLSQAPDRLTLLGPLWDADLPQVWDADALTLLARSGRKPPRNALLTPHPGEAARLLACSIAEIVKAPVEAAQALARRMEAVVVLKGATSVITDGMRAALNLTGCPALARGGSGDVLTGFAAALLSQGMGLWEAGWAAAHFHGRAGERAAADLGERGMTAWDLPPRLLSRH